MWTKVMSATYRAGPYKHLSDCLALSSLSKAILMSQVSNGLTTEMWGCICYCSIAFPTLTNVEHKKGVLLGSVVLLSPGAISQMRAVLPQDGW